MIFRIRSRFPDLDRRILDAQTGFWATFTTSWTSAFHGSWDTRHTGWKKDSYRDELYARDGLKLLVPVWKVNDIFVNKPQ